MAQVDDNKILDEMINSSPILKAVLEPIKEQLRTTTPEQRTALFNAVMALGSPQPSNKSDKD